MEDSARLELEFLHASGVRLVAIRAPDGAPEACLVADETLYTTERALQEAPLPHAPSCACFYAPRGGEDGQSAAGPASERADRRDDSLLLLAY